MKSKIYLCCFTCINFTMNIFLIILAFILILIGIAGSFVPVLPGPPLAWVGILVASFSSFIDISTNFLIISALITISLTIFDYILPSLNVRKKGGSKEGEKAAFWGGIIGVFFGPWGIIIFPFLGAFLGELILNGSKANHALNIAMHAFIGFILSTGLKLIWGSYLGVWLVMKLII